VAKRLELVVHALAAGTAASIFGDPGHLLDQSSIAPLEGRVSCWYRGPELACAETTTALGGTAEVIYALRGCDFGSWTGRSLAELGVEKPDGVRQWLNDAQARPHGGESLAQLVSRVGATIDQWKWPDGRSVVVVAPLVVRAIIAHVLQAPPTVIFRIDVSPLSRVAISRGTDVWRLRFGAQPAEITTAARAGAGC
jgi:broad specificity phosphatase PhoE